MPPKPEDLAFQLQTKITIDVIIPRIVNNFTGRLITEDIIKSCFIKNEVNPLTLR